MLDKVNSTASITVTTGALVITTKVYCNAAVAAAFAAVTSGQAYPVVTVGTGFINVVTTVTPDTAVGIVAETMKYLEINGKGGAGTMNV